MTHRATTIQIIEATLQALQLEKSEMNMSVLSKVLSKTEVLILKDPSIIVSSDMIYVPTGSIKLLDAKVLKAEGPAKYFVLFPNLPNELRNKIYESIAEGHPTPYVIFTETAGKNGVHYYTVRAPVPAIILASNEAARNFSASEKYNYFNAKGCSLKSPILMPKWEDRDFILRSAVSQPKLILSKYLVRTMDIHLIGQLCMDFNEFKPENITWILNNIKRMPKLKYFQLNAALPIGKNVKEFNVRVDFADIHSTGREFEPIYVDEEGFKVVGFGCWNTHVFKLVPQKYQQAMWDVGMLLDRCLRTTSKFPGVVHTYWKSVPEHK
jgi:hypothetical protein